MYLGKSLDWQQTPTSRRARLRFVGREVLIAVGTAGGSIPLFVYLLLEAIP